MKPKSIPSASAEMLDVTRAPSGNVEITARPRRRPGPREIVVVVEPREAIELARRLVAVAEGGPSAEPATVPAGPEQSAAIREGQQRAREAGVRMGRPREVPDRVVRRLAALRDEGLSLAEVAERMNHSRTKPARGERWTREMVRTLLRRRGEGA